jgi:hypothetical protein
MALPNREPAMPLQWRAGPESEPEERLRRLQSRFRKASSRIELASKLRRLRRAAWTWGPTAITMLAIAIAVVGLVPLPTLVSIRHLAAFPSCAAARAVGFDKPRRGEPGYWQRNDEDRDGVACEWNSYPFRSARFFWHITGDTDAAYGARRRRR